MIESLLNILTDALPSGKVSDWIQTLFTYKKSFRKAVEISYDDFLSRMATDRNLLGVFNDKISNTHVLYLMIDVCSTSDEFVNGQILGLDKRYRIVFNIKSPDLNKIFANEGVSTLKVFLPSK